MRSTTSSGPGTVPRSPSTTHVAAATRKTASKPTSSLERLLEELPGGSSGGGGDFEGLWAEEEADAEAGSEREG